MNTQDLEHLGFIYNRMIDVHHENVNVDYMIRFKNILIESGVVSPDFDNYELVRVKEYGDGCEPLRFNCGNGSCIGHSGDNMCGHYMGDKVIGNIQYAYCVDVNV